MTSTFWTYSSNHSSSSTNILSSWHQLYRTRGRRWKSAAQMVSLEKAYCQWHLEDDSKRDKYSDIVLKKGSRTIVLELLATGEPSSVRSHIQKTPVHAALLSANEAWVVHFTRQEDYQPIWQSDTDLSKNINLVHFAHDLKFTNVVMNACWKNCAGEIQRVEGMLLPSN